MEEVVMMTPIGLIGGTLPPHQVVMLTHPPVPTHEL